jgi:hypothetical protein
VFRGRAPAHVWAWRRVRSAAAASLKLMIISHTPLTDPPSLALQAVAEIGGAGVDAASGTKGGKEKKKDPRQVRTACDRVC